MIDRAAKVDIYDGRYEVRVVDINMEKKARALINLAKGKL